ncbi:MAG: hypothetical protein CMJ46_05480 [Planctomyces sp.]|nr:hypothetical protein [Planctomyces sp.]
MIATEFETLQAHPDYVRVLNAYLEAEKNLPEDQASVPRLLEVAEVPTARLSAIHGNLIALDYLRFELADRHSGLQYKVTTSAKQSLNLLEKIMAGDEAVAA